MNVVRIQTDPTAPIASGDGRFDPRPVEGETAPHPDEPIGIFSESIAAWKAAVRESPWLPVASKALGVVIAMLVLAAIGVASIGIGAGIRIDEKTRALLASSSRSDLAQAWLATAAKDPHASSSPRAPAPVPAPAAIAHPHADTKDAGAPSKSKGVTEDGRIVLNVATVEELTRLPGVGTKRAEQIVQLRERLKRFRRIEDLLRVRGIGVKSLRRLKPMLVLDPPDEAPSKEEKPKEPARG